MFKLKLSQIKIYFTSFRLFQWQTNGSMSMAKSSNIAAAWTLKSERGRAIAGPLGVQEPASTIERHTCRRREGGSRRMSAQAREMKAVVGQPASVLGAPGPRDPGAHGAAVDVDSTRLRGGEEEGRGCWQSAPRGQTLSLALTGQFLQMEGAFPHTVLVSVNCVCKAVCLSCWLKNRHMQSFSYIPGSLLSLQINTAVLCLCRRSELYFECVLVYRESTHAWIIVKCV